MSIEMDIDQCVGIEINTDQHRSIKTNMDECRLISIDLYRRTDQQADMKQSRLAKINRD